MRILLVEDFPGDAEFIERTLQKEKIGFISQRVENKSDYIGSLLDFNPNIILSDHNLPGFDSLSALSIKKELRPEIPFILVTGSVSEEFAVTCIKEGADDYVLKANLSRLPSAMQNAFTRRKLETENITIKRLHLEIKEKNKDIVDSITYAKRLQDAILPPLKSIKKHLPESFVLYKPKDILAGDFYWMDIVGDNTLLAACDCTGHGIPGAMVSIVCFNALNRALNEYKIRETGKVLDKARELVLKTFEKSESTVNDGMDISFCAINTKESRLEWSGANNPLWYIRNGEMKEIRADKQPIGQQSNSNPFTTHTLNIQKGDIIYLFTDGYADQFGGPKGKKFKYKQLQEKLLGMTEMSMDNQRKVLDETLEAWRGNLEQVDDVLVIGIRI